jgi:hypothetical protein
MQQRAVPARQCPVTEMVLWAAIVEAVGNSDYWTIETVSIMLFVTKIFTLPILEEGAMPPKEKARRVCE